MHHQDRRFLCRQQREWCLFSRVVSRGSCVDVSGCCPSPWVGYFSKCGGLASLGSAPSVWSLPVASSELAARNSNWHLQLCSSALQRMLVWSALRIVQLCRTHIFEVCAVLCRFCFVMQNMSPTVSDENPMLGFWFSVLLVSLARIQGFKPHSEDWERRWPATNSANRLRQLVRRFSSFCQRWNGLRRTCNQSSH